MKCLLCTRNFQDKNLLKNHYILKHKTNPNNWFFKALFKKEEDTFFVRKCCQCEQFLTSISEEKKHNFSKHFQKGGQMTLANRPIEIKTDTTVKKFSIEYDKRKSSYDFMDPIKLLEDFFNVVDIKFNTDGKKGDSI